MSIEAWVVVVLIAIIVVPVALMVVVGVVRLLWDLVCGIVRAITGRP